LSDTRDIAETLDIAATFEGKNILIIGTTGFVGKVMLSMLLRNYPGIGRVYCLVRPGMGNTADERFFSKVATSPAFDPLREVWGDGYESFMREKIRAIPGDIGRPLCNFTDEQFAEFEQNPVECMINSAGLVSFTPPLESAIRINSVGAVNVLETARKLGAALVHVSTCYVAGLRDGEVWEDEPVVGYFPRHDELLDDDFDAQAEIDDCVRIIEQTREMAKDRAHISEFRERAAETLRQQRRDPDDPKSLRLAVARERKIWVATKLTELGMERAKHWGWTNTYTYTKSLGEQVILSDKEVRAAIVRPAIVESALRYPFGGWNEGFNTTAPLLYLFYKGQRQIAAGERTHLDIIPVDMVAAGMIAATAAIMTDQHEPVYQLCSSGSNPVFSRRLGELSGLAVRKHRRELADAGEEPTVNRIRARLEVFPVSKERFDRFSAPVFKRIADRLSTEIDQRLPTWGAPRLRALAERAQDELEKVSSFTGQVQQLVELFLPFIHDMDIIYRNDNMHALYARLSVADQQALPWAPNDINWRDYWIDSHFPGLLEWVFPILDDEFGTKPRSVYTHKDLVELFDATTKLHRHRVALRLLPTRDEDSEPIVYTYERVQEMAVQGAGMLRQHGIAPDDRVMLMSENRPEWGITYFAIIKAAATVVPLDAALSFAEVSNLVRASGAKIFVISDDQVERLCGDESIGSDDDSMTTIRSKLSAAFEAAGTPIEMLGFDELLVEPAVSPAAITRKRKGDAVASLIYTSGTTGDPKGVMLTHKNITSMASKLSSVFKLYRSDGLLSVLPLHHTFEFSAGFIMPFVHGSSITYLDEIDADGLSAAFDEGNITGMVGVPALWQLLYRKIFKTISERGPVVQWVFDGFIELNRKLRDRIPYGGHLGKLLFYPIHRKFGGRVRLMISGGSALGSDVMKAFRGMGFQLVEGYGMTESSPVLTVTRPHEAPIIGSVGRALPGIDVKIDNPDDGGVGEVIAKGPNVMKGYYNNEEATSQVLQDGWLHTGDLGRLDDDGNLFIVGRKKEMILGASGENVYPDELEDIYLDSIYVKELSVVGLPAGEHETVAALVVPDYEQDDLSREEVREKVREHMREMSNKLPLYKRVKVYQLWDHDLPRTSTRKIKRREVIAELEKLERAAKGATDARKAAAETPADDGATTATTWVRDVLAQVSQKKRDQVGSDRRLDELGFDSLMFTELGVALEAAGVALPDASELNELETVGDVEKFVARQGVTKPADRKRKQVVDDGADQDEIRVPEPLVRWGRRGLRRGMRALYEQVLNTKVTGKAYIPPFGGFIVAANHASHLDMGLVKHTLGETGELLVALAAKDYFFQEPVRKAYFENFTNLMPMERYGSLRESLRMAGQVIREGEILLIFPEGTRSKTGVMIDFKPSLGYLALHNRCGILPMYLAGTHNAMPKGSYLPKERDISSHVGPFMSYEALVTLTEGLSRSESYRKIAENVERVVRSLAPADYEWTLGEAGRVPVAEYEAQNASTER